MKRKELETLRSHGVQELEAELNQTREKKLGLEFKHASSPIPNPLELRKLRRKAAVIRTLLREKAVAKGKSGN